MTDLFRDLGQALQSPPFALAAAALFGLVLGSFLNVVIARLPRMIDGAASSLAFPASHCPCCRAPIRWRHNLPLLGFALLRGRCADCGTAIGWHYPLIEAAAAVLTMLAIQAFGATVMGFAAAAMLLLLLTLAAIDWRDGLLPDALVLPGIALGLGINGFGVFVAPSDALIGAGGAFVAMTTLRLGYRKIRGRDGMGAGDPKLLALIGAWLGVDMVLMTMLLAFAIGTIVGLGLVLARRADPASALPFGPVVALASLPPLFAGDALSQAYWRLLI